MTAVESTNDRPSTADWAGTDQAAPVLMNWGVRATKSSIPFGLMALVPKPCNQEPQAEPGSSDGAACSAAGTGSSPCGPKSAVPGVLKPAPRQDRVVLTPSHSR